MAGGNKLKAMAWSGAEGTLRSTYRSSRRDSPTFGSRGSPLSGTGCARYHFTELAAIIDRRYNKKLEIFRK